MFFSPKRVFFPKYVRTSLSEPELIYEIFTILDIQLSLSSFAYKF